MIWMGWDLKNHPCHEVENLPLEFCGQFYDPEILVGFGKALKNHLVPTPLPDPSRSNAVP